MVYEQEMRQLTTDLINKYGQIIEVNCLPGRKIELVFNNGTIPLPSNHIMQFGYLGTEPQCFYTFLVAAGFNVSRNEIETLVA